MIKGFLVVVGLLLFSIGCLVALALLAIAEANEIQEEEKERWDIH